MFAFFFFDGRGCGKSDICLEDLAWEIEIFEDLVLECGGFPLSFYFEVKARGRKGCCGILSLAAYLSSISSDLTVSVIQERSAFGSSWK